MDGNTITFTTGFGTCPAFPNAAGFPALVSQVRQGNSSSFVCTYNVELFDWDTNVTALIAKFVPEAISPADESILFEKTNSNCSGSTQGNCPEWRKISLKLLPSYCKRISYFAFGANPNGECHLYELNPFNPDLPQSKGCNRMTSLTSLCFAWNNASSTQGVSNTIQTTVNCTKEKYCPIVTTPDCACLEAQKSIVFKEVSGVVGDSRCWWRPCQLSEQRKFLLVQNGDPKCEGSVCLNINNVFLDHSVIGGDVINNELNTCARGKPPPPPWYEQWWFWIIVFAISIILFATLIYFGSQT